MPKRRFERFDCLAEKRTLLEIAREISCTKVFVDIGGNRHVPALVDLLPWLQLHLQPRLIVLKSEKVLENALAHLMVRDSATARDADQSASASPPQEAAECAAGARLHTACFRGGGQCLTSCECRAARTAQGAPEA